MASDTVRIQQPHDQCVLPNQNTMDNKSSGVLFHVNELVLSVLVENKVNGTEVELLVNTEATANLMKAGLFGELETPVRLFKYKGLLETADGRQWTIIGRARMRIELGSFDDEIVVFIVHDLQPQLILGLRTLTKHHCSIDLYSSQL